MNSIVAFNIIRDIYPLEEIEKKNIIEHGKQNSRNKCLHKYTYH